MPIGLGQWLIKKVGRFLTKNHAPLRAYLCDFDRIRYEIRPADVLLIEGRNHISHSIQQITLSSWSHAILYIGRIDDVDDLELRKLIEANYQGDRSEQLVIESLLGKGTIITPLTAYQGDHIRICRPSGLSRADAQKVISYAVRRLGCQYNLRHIFDLMRFLFPWPILPRRWRSTIFEHNALQPTHDICSSMIARAFQSVKFPILPIVKIDYEKGIELIVRDNKLFTPSDFDYSPYFNIIKYPFFSIAERTSYTDLPWREGSSAIEDHRKVHIIEHPKSESDAKASNDEDENKKHKKRE